MTQYYEAQKGQGTHDVSGANGNEIFIVHALDAKVFSDYVSEFLSNLNSL